MNDLAAAVALLTVWPVRRKLDFTAAALAYFPIVGAVLAVVLVVTFELASQAFPALVVAALVTALWALLTGALHLDGVSDACDALFSATSRERRLEILRDVHVGAFGAVGLIVILLLKFAALANVPVSSVFLAPILARWAMVFAATFPLARPDGMAVLFRQGFGRRQLTLATLAAFVFTVPFGWQSVAAWIAAVVVTSIVAKLALARLGGLTGDVYGLICEMVEVTILLLGTWRWHLSA